MSTASEQILILVVDDDAATADLLVELLNEEPGYCAYPINSAEQALAVLARQHIDLLVLDIEMPRMSGKELYERVQACEHSRGAHVLFMTAGRTAGQVALDTGHLVIEKPFNLDVFLDAVRRTLAVPNPGVIPGTMRYPT